MAERSAAFEQIRAIADEEGLQVLGWREVPVDPTGADIGATALGCMPYMAQLFVAAPDRVGGATGLAAHKIIEELRNGVSRAKVFHNGVLEWEKRPVTRKSWVHKRQLKAEKTFYGSKIRTFDIYCKYYQ
jgi:glutamate synthase domain-containing protein 1